MERRSVAREQNPEELRTSPLKLMVLLKDSH